MRLKKNKNLYPLRIQRIDKYKKHVEQLTNAFDQLTQSTGVNGLQNIVTTTLHSEHQRHALSKYLNELTSEIDNLTADTEGLRVATSTGHSAKSSQLQQVAEQHAAVGARSARQQQALQNVTEKTKKLEQELSQAQLWATKILQLGQVTPTEDLGVLQTMHQLESFVSKMLTIAACQKQASPVLSNLPVRLLRQRSQGRTKTPVREILNAPELRELLETEEASPLMPAYLIRARAKDLLDVITSRLTPPKPRVPRN